MADSRLIDILRQSHWHVRPERFVMAGLHPRERLLVTQLLAGVVSPFVQMIAEPDMLTLVLPESDWRTLSPAFPRARLQRPFRVISFDLDLPEDLVGFLAVISRALADAGVPILAICGYSKDHIMVRDADLDRALAAITALASTPEQE